MDRFHHLLNQALERNASDLLLQPTNDDVTLSWNVDGLSQNLAKFSLNEGKALVARIKYLAQMDISQTRLPQDGRLSWKWQERIRNIRVATLPVLNGERVAMRILDTHTSELHALGMSEAMRIRIEAELSIRHGLWIAAGPTGCGKTTTLHACLRWLTQSALKILSAEDPVEYEIEGVQQIAVRDSIGLDYPRALRSILRQDADVILIGETRDTESALIGVQAALTGHLVFTSLHTANTLESIARLVSMGVEAHFLADVLRVVIAQRLVRRLCSHCKRRHELTEAWESIGCEHCYQSGWNGRLGVFEILTHSPALRSAILQKLSTPEMRQLGLAPADLKEDATRWLISGETTQAEVEASLC